jgi:NitT/TauT family transport system substrate-binding protein
MTRQEQNSGSIRVWTARALMVVVFMGALLWLPRGAAALEHLTVRLDWLPRGYQGVLYLAAKEGYYKDAGLDIEIFDGKGSVATLQSVAGGNDMIGLASLTDMAVAITKGMPLLAIACIIPKDPDAIVALKGTGIAKPKDVEGKRMGFVPGANAERVYRAFVAANNINGDNVKMVQMSPATTHPMLLNGNVDFIVAWSPTDAMRISREKPIDLPLVLADHGVNVLAMGLVVTNDTAAKRGDVLRGFLTALSRAAHDAKQNPASVVDAVLKYRPSENRSILTDENEQIQAFLQTKNTAGHPYGWMAQADWAETNDILKQYYDVPKDLSVAGFYTNDFLPPQ